MRAARGAMRATGPWTQGGAITPRHDCPIMSHARLPFSPFAYPAVPCSTVPYSAALHHRHTILTPYNALDDPRRSGLAHPVELLQQPPASCSANARVSVLVLPAPPNTLRAPYNGARTVFSSHLLQL